MNYTVSEDYTRITEFKNLTGQHVPGKTTIMKEYSHAYEPGSGQTPYTRFWTLITASSTSATATA